MASHQLMFKVHFKCSEMTQTYIFIHLYIYNYLYIYGLNFLFFYGYIESIILLERNEIQVFFLKKKENKRLKEVQGSKERLIF